ncbi:MAG: membrane integrity-associated transporter subunit PqiC [Bradymonadales bacterium]|nr:membrane integrity-associated transporter subunit PqiC [Bradymonadales bacterium]
MASPFPKHWHLTVGVLLILLPVLAVLQGSCSLFGSRGKQALQTYIFSPRHVERVADQSANIILLVAPLRSAGYDSRQMTYTQRPYEHTYYAFSQWAESPPRLIEPLLVQAMEASGLFSSVVDVSATVLADIRMDVELLVLQHEYHVVPSQGRIMLRVQLADLRTRTVLGTRLFESVHPAPTDDPYGGVLALNLALEELLSQIILYTEQVIADWQRPAQK